MIIQEKGISKSFLIMETFIYIVLPLIIVVITIAILLRKLANKFAMEVTESAILYAFDNQKITSVKPKNETWNKEYIIESFQDELWNAGRKFAMTRAELKDPKKQVENGRVLNDIVRIVKIVSFLLFAYENDISIEDLETKEITKL